MVDGRPYLILGGQIHNSSAWPIELPQVWESIATLHANTVEAPVYWEQLEPREGHFDFDNVDRIVEGARSHNLRVVLLWFGTWKNGNMHYVPAWVKTDTRRFPRVIRPDGEPIDVLSALSRNTLEADKTAFVALMRHLKQIDGEQHTVLLIQVENESGNIGSVRHKFREAEPQIRRSSSLRSWRPPTNNRERGAKSSRPMRTKCFSSTIRRNISMRSPRLAKPSLRFLATLTYGLIIQLAELPQRQLDLPGIGYPSGGPVQKLVGLWRALATSIDMIGPDIYADDSQFYRETMRVYHRPDNPLWIPEPAVAIVSPNSCLRPRRWCHRLFSIWRGSIRVEHLWRRRLARTRAQLCPDRAYKPRDCSTGV